jgi:alpha-glucosidase
MNPYEQLLPVFSIDQAEVHDIVKTMRLLADEYDDRVLIGEIYLPINRLVAYYGSDKSGVHLPFNFQLLVTPWNADHIASIIDQYEGALPADGWPNWVLSNHDQPRITSRVGIAQARIAAMLLLTLRGTPTIYYGDEIGMRDTPIPFDEVQDPQGLNMPELNLSRDPARTPMQWDSTENGGFSTAKPWLRLPADFRRRNVKIQENDPISMLTYYKKLIKLRQQEPALKTGSYSPVYSDKQIISYVRECGKNRFLIVLNLSHRPCYFKPAHFKFSGTIELASIPELEGKTLSDCVNLAGDEGVIIRLS